jgi:hypothetical protein
MWGCNISNLKIAEVLTHLRSKITSLEISDCPKEIKKQAVKSIAEIFLYQNYQQQQSPFSEDKKKKQLSSLLIQRTPLNVKSLD